MQKEQIKYPQGMKWTKQRKCVYEVLLHAKEPLSAIQIYNCIMKNTEWELAKEGYVRSHGKDGVESHGSNNTGGYSSIGAGNYAVSTIYRILTAFEEKGLVTKSNWMDSGTFAYELNRGEHTHYAVCLSCHKHIPLHACPFEHMHLPEAEGDFKITGHKLELYGYCGDCRG